MGVLNCQKCFNNDNKNKNEIITGNNLLLNQKVLFALDSRKSTLSPRTNCESSNQNKLNHFLHNKEKCKKMSLKSKKFSSLDDEYTNELDYNTIEIPNDDEDSFDSIEEKKSYEKSEKNQDSEENYKIRLKNAEELFGYDEDSLNRNSNNLHMNTNNNNNNFIQNYDNDDEIKKTLDTKDKCDLNDFINEKIKEKRINELNSEEKITKEQTLENNSNENAKSQSNYNIIIGNNCLNYNYQCNLYNNFSDIQNFGNLNNYINQKIEEENEEYEQEKNIIDISDINNNNDINLNRYKSSTFSQNELKNKEKNEILDKKNSIKSEEINTRKGTKNEGSNEFINYNFSNNYHPPDDRSAISYEIEYIDDNNNYDNENNNKNIIIENKEEIDINNGIDLNRLSHLQKKNNKFYRKYRTKFRL